MIQLSRDLDCRHKTAFALAHKLREAMAGKVHTGEVLDGHVEVDGAYFGGTIRPENHKADRVDRRLARHQTGTRRVVAPRPAAPGDSVGGPPPARLGWRLASPRRWSPMHPARAPRPDAA